MGELLELVPFHKQLFSSDSYGVAETATWARCTTGGAWPGRSAPRLDRRSGAPPDAARVAHMIGSGNARRVYRL